ncbi:hypothetical protein [Metamycoplasma auris]|nr:hypothetical protein [Metamycoplasma auris]
MQLKEFLKSKGFLVSFSNLKLDAIFKVDLIAIKENQKLYVQLKNRFVNFSISDRKKLIHFANIRNSIPLLVTKQKNTYSFWNLISEEEFNF